MTKTLKFLAYLGLAAALGAPATALAAITYTYTGYGNVLCNYTGSSCASQTQSGVTATASAWADSGSAGDVGNKLKQGNLYAYSGGLGVQWVSSSTTETLTVPQHSIDNCGSGGSYCTGAASPQDAVLFSFNSAVTMTDFGIGWYSGDSDVTILAYTGSGIPNLTQDTYSMADGTGGNTVGLLNTGWSLIGNYNNAGQSTQTNCGGVYGCVSTSVSSNVSSQYWLVAAYNGAVQGTADQNNDFFKICAITVTPGQGQQPPPPGAPEPGTTALLGITFPMLAWSRRRRPKPVIA